MSKPRIVLWTPFTGQQQALAAGLRDEAGIELLALASAAEAVAALGTADGALLAGAHMGFLPAVAQAVHAAPRLRWVQLLSTGQEAVDEHGVPARVTVTGVGTSSAPVVAEHAMALLLALARRLGEAAVLGRAARWDRNAVATHITSVEGKTLCLAGYGRIGQEIARRAQAFGMRCIAVNRSGRNDAPQLAAQVFTMERLHEALAQADAVAISFPASPATERLFGAAEWAACRRGALVVNVGRGSVVDTDALVAALQGGQLGGAGLDVTAPEPLPDGHPLWTAPGALISPHVGGGGSHEGTRRLIELVRDNIRRFGAGEPLQHVVEVGA